MNHNTSDQNTQPGLDISIIVPVYNEEENIADLLQETLPHLSASGLSYEVILINDGSKDGTWLEIQKAANNDPCVKGVSLSRNFGHQHALFCGLHFAGGRAMICMDGDLQHPPSMIPKMLHAWKEGAKVVTTTRISNAKTSWLKKTSSRYYYKLFTFLSGVPLHEGTSDFCLIDRQAFEAFKDFKDANLFLRGIVHWVGFPSASLAYQEGERKKGKSKYSLLKMLHLGLTGIISFSTVPLKLGIWAGLLMSAFSFFELVYILTRYLQGATVPGWASTVGVVSLLFGILFILLGCIGIYLADIHNCLKNRPPFIVEKIVNIRTGDERKDDRY
ncbi:MAG TPA: glycosyltransferase family 2 protein [Candidatus Omnitrophota bacterium]|nr:glycosyltransferase family 2 protein [Candidatus Omnitrophota bacterium]